MPPLYWAPCIVYGSTRYYLPPSISISDSWGQSIEVISPKYTSRAIIAEIHDNQPVKLSLDAKTNVRSDSTQREVLDWFYEIRTQFRARKFALYLFHDRAYQVCALESSDFTIDRKPLLAKNVSLQITSEGLMTAAVESLTFPNGYDIDYPYAHLVGRPLGDADDTGVVPVMTTPFQTPSGQFSGVIESESAEGDEQSVVIGGSTSSRWLLDSIQITAADNTTATDDTIISASLEPYDAGNPPASVSSTITSAQKFGDKSLAMGTELVAGNRIYVRVAQGGGHSNVQYTIHLKGA